MSKRCTSKRGAWRLKRGYERYYRRRSVPRVDVQATVVAITYISFSIRVEVTNPRGPCPPARVYEIPRPRVGSALAVFRVKAGAGFVARDAVDVPAPHAEEVACRITDNYSGAPRALMGEMSKGARFPVIHKRIIAYGNEIIIGCDARCDKAWGTNQRPRIEVSEREDDYAFLADAELGTAPADAGIYEGGHAKPKRDGERLNKWCFRECERSAEATTLDDIDLPDLSRRVYNWPPYARG
jgi:hypothetical protein